MTTVRQHVSLIPQHTSWAELGSLMSCLLLPGCDMMQLLGRRHVKRQNTFAYAL